MRLVVRGTPFGDERWPERTAKRLRLESALRPRGRPRNSVTCSALTYLSVGAISLREPLERVRLRAEYPFESLSVRLAYEREHKGVAGVAVALAHEAEELQDGSGSKSIRSEIAQKELKEFEDRLEEEEPRIPWRGNRARALAQIDESQVDFFMNSSGFGVVRMMPRSPVEDAEIAPPKSIRLPAAQPVDLDSTPPEQIVELRQAAEPPSTNQLREMHREGAVDFVNQRGWGYVQDRDHVAGFQVHHFRKVPSTTAENVGRRAGRSRRADDSVTSDRPSESQSEDDWTIVRVQLVSLLKHDEPCVYVTDDLPRMDKMADVPVRPLDAFEGRALRSLEAGEDVVSESFTNQVRMVGAVRAAKQCLKCHSVERGELLGAFSYVIDRTRPVRPKRERTEPVF